MKKLKPFSTLATVFAILMVLNFSYSTGHTGKPLVAFGEGSRDSAYVCSTPKPAVYHTRRDCGALKRCTHSIQLTTTDSAAASGKRLCKLCSR